MDTDIFKLKLLEKLNRRFLKDVTEPEEELKNVHDMEIDEISNNQIESLGDGLLQGQNMEKRDRVNSGSLFDSRSYDTVSEDIQEKSHDEFSLKKEHQQY